MSRRTQIQHLSHIDIRTDYGEVVGALLIGSDEDGTVEWNLSQEAARQLLKAVGSTLLALTAAPEAG
jgi:hypothetical protein